MVTLDGRILTQYCMGEVKDTQTDENETKQETKQETEQETKESQGGNDNVQERISAISQAYSLRESKFKELIVSIFGLAGKIHFHPLRIEILVNSESLSFKIHCHCLF